jgi:hypothetical protein
MSNNLSSTFTKLRVAATAAKQVPEIPSTLPELPGAVIARINGLVINATVNLKEARALLSEHLDQHNTSC